MSLTSARKIKTGSLFFADFVYLSPLSIVFESWSLKFESPPKDGASKSICCLFWNFKVGFYNLELQGKSSFILHHCCIHLFIFSTFTICFHSIAFKNLSIFLCVSHWFLFPSTGAVTAVILKNPVISIFVFNKFGFIWETESVTSSSAITALQLSASPGKWILALFIFYSMAIFTSQQVLKLQSHAVESHLVVRTRAYLLGQCSVHVI